MYRQSFQSWEQVTIFREHTELVLQESRIQVDSGVSKVKDTYRVISTAMFN